MSNHYISRINSLANKGYEVWRCDEDGKPIEVVPSETAELNYLWRLVEDSVSMARLEERTKVRHAIMLENIHVDGLHEHFTPVDSDFTYVRKDDWNRLVRVIRSVWKAASGC